MSFTAVYLCSWERYWWVPWIWPGSLRWRSAARCPEQSWGGRAVEYDPLSPSSQTLPSGPFLSAYIFPKRQRQQDHKRKKLKLMIYDFVFPPGIYTIAWYSLYNITLPFSYRAARSTCEPGVLWSHCQKRPAAPVAFWDASPQRRWTWLKLAFWVSLNWPTGDKERVWKEYYNTQYNMKWFKSM